MIQNNVNENKENETENESSDIIEVNIALDQFVMYDGEWHVAKIIKIDKGDETCHFKFMRKSQGRTIGNPLFKWPTPEDKLWRPFTDILCNLQEPMKVGRGGRSYEIKKEEYEKSNELMRSRLAMQSTFTNN